MVTMSGKVSQFSDKKYINLETYRKSGKAVCTPVWFVVHNDTIYIITTKETGKVKRIRNNQAVRVAPCGFRGEIKGEWVSGTARFAEKDESEKALALRKKKYGLQARLVGAIVARKGEPVVIAISI
ncbi:MAG: PPOX class F420-dependent oxidoreductase [Candidatus Nitrosotenuis sp.]|nr:MAG: PPOX class F420-dependent oxidoreductase [Candidatus Nitrosotenuis sp.]